MIKDSLIKYYAIVEDPMENEHGLQPKVYLIDSLYDDGRGFFNRLIKYAGKTVVPNWNIKSKDDPEFLEWNQENSDKFWDDDTEWWEYCKYSVKEISRLQYCNYKLIRELYNSTIDEIF